MLIEILANLGMSMVMFLRGMPSDEKVKQNIELLSTSEWFKQIYSKNEELFKKDKDLRFIVGSEKVERTLISESRTAKLRKKILEAINDSSYKFSS